MSAELSFAAQADAASANSYLFPDRLLTGFQPTGTIHLGHIAGALTACLRLQDVNPGECFILIADLHYLSARPEGAQVRQAITKTVRSMLALGIDPERCVIYRQSEVPQLCELLWTLSCYISKGTLERGHAVRTAIAEGRMVSAGVLLYPLLQAADILGLRATRIPAGQDQRQHIELAREVARRINALGDYPVLPEPNLATSDIALLIGTDGIRKMSLENGNFIGVFEDATTIHNQVNSIISVNVRQGDPVSPEEVFALKYLSLVAPQALVAEVRSGLTDGTLGLHELKKKLTASILEHFGPARERFHELADQKSLIEDILADGSARAREEAADTLLAVRDLVGY